MALYRKDGTAEYQGLVIDFEFGKSVQIMSDIWGSEDRAMVWDDTEGRPKHVSLKLDDQGCHYTYYAGEIDATEEVLKKYREYREERIFEDRARMVREEEFRIRKGDFVKVIKGKTGVGEIGEVFWIGESKWGMKYGLAITAEKVEKTFADGKTAMVFRDVIWVYGYNVEKLHVDKKIEARMPEARQIAEEVADREIEQLKIKPTAKQFKYKEFEEAA